PRRRPRALDRRPPSTAGPPRLLDLLGGRHGRPPLPEGRLRPGPAAAGDAGGGGKGIKEKVRIRPALERRGWPATASEPEILPGQNYDRRSKRPRLHASASRRRRRSPPSPSPCPDSFCTGRTPPR